MTGRRDQEEPAPKYAGSAKGQKHSDFMNISIENITFLKTGYVSLPTAVTSLSALRKKRLPVPQQKASAG